MSGTFYQWIHCACFDANVAHGYLVNGEPETCEKLLESSGGAPFAEAVAQKGVDSPAIFVEFSQGATPSSPRRIAEPHEADVSAGLVVSCLVDDAAPFAPFPPVNSSMSLGALEKVEEEKVHSSWPAEPASPAIGENVSRDVTLPNLMTTNRTRTLDKSPPNGSPMTQFSRTPRTPNSIGSTRSSTSRFARGRPTTPRSIPDEERRPVVSHGVKWTVKISRPSVQTRLGLDTDDVPQRADRQGCLKVTDVSSDGLVHFWNAANPKKAMEKGDYIVEVNGVIGNPEELHEALVRDTFMEIVVLRGS